MMFCSRVTSRRLSYQLSNRNQTYNKINNNQLKFIRNVSSTRPTLGILHHEWIVSGKVASEEHHHENDTNRVVVLLHGLLGNGKNLRTPAKKLTEYHPSLSVLLLDLRGHGMTHVNKSKNPFSPPHTIDACANDIHETLTHLKLVGPQRSPIGIIGHSFGGRCALSYTHQQLQNFAKQINSNDDNMVVVHPPKHTWLLDTVPGIADASVANVVNVLSQVKVPIHNKREFGQDLIQKHNIDPAIAGWMTTNLTKIENGFDFTFDLNVIHSVLDDFPKQPFLPMIRDCISEKKQPTNHNIHVVIAGKNKEWTDDILKDLQTIKEENDNHSLLEMHTLTKAGHWVHVDDLNGLLNIINQGLSTK